MKAEKNSLLPEIFSRLGTPALHEALRKMHLGHDVGAHHSRANQADADGFVSEGAGVKVGGQSAGLEGAQDVS